MSVYACFIICDGHLLCIMFQTCYIGQVTPALAKLVLQFIKKTVDFVVVMVILQLLVTF